jgi:NAD(P)-dependent dehydrogenase (short-subunit alcohol dehydrogenase family)
LNGSTAGTIGMAGLSVYAASKAAVRNFARSWTLDLKGRGIRVNVLSPGATLTPGVLGLAGPDREKQALIATLTADIPMGRIADPDEIAKAAVFLASDDSSFVAGTELFVDGGTAQV